jgi:hypothetical protein
MPDFVQQGEAAEIAAFRDAIADLQSRLDKAIDEFAAAYRRSADTGEMDELKDRIRELRRRLSFCRSLLQQQLTSGSNQMG